MERNLTPKQAFDLYQEAYEENDWQCEDEFLGLMDAVKRYNIQLTNDQKESIGEFLKENRDDDLCQMYEDYWVDHRTKEEYDADNYEMLEQFDENFKKEN